MPTTVRFCQLALSLALLGSSLGVLVTGSRSNLAPGGAPRRLQGDSLARGLPASPTTALLAAGGVYSARAWMCAVSKVSVDERAVGAGAKVNVEVSGCPYCETFAGEATVGADVAAAVSSQLHLHRVGGVGRAPKLPV